MWQSENDNITLSFIALQFCIVFASYDIDFLMVNGILYGYSLASYCFTFHIHSSAMQSEDVYCVCNMHSENRI